ncbi:MAG: TRAP transporter large permease subunit [Alphaproteobacteria bacterium]|nr:TRAP transporter large permease subunit [Alphaproteobacteria bacterium]
MYLKSLKFVDRIINAVTILSAWAASIAIILATLLICLDVSLRNLFSFPINGVSEIVGYGIVSVVFLQIGISIRRNRLISAEIFSNIFQKISPNFSDLLNILFFSAALMVFYLISVYFWNDFHKAFVGDEFTGAIGAFQIPTWPFKLVNSIATIIIIFEIIRILILHINSIFQNGIGNKKDVILQLGLLLAVISISLFLIEAPLTRPALGFVAFGGMLLLVLIGMPIGIALMFSSFAGIWLIINKFPVAFKSLGMSSATAIQSFEFGVVPLFVLMGLLLERGDVGKDAFALAVRALSWLKGGLGIATVFANAIFASITGSSLASASVFSRIAVPPMVYHGFKNRFAVGVVAGSSVLGMLIPPSILLIIYGILAEVSIGKLFIAGILPGILLSCIFGLMIFCAVKFFPNAVLEKVNPSQEIPEVEEKQNGFLQVLPILFLIFLVMGGIYAGFFSPTEAGAVGAFGALLTAILRKKINFQSFKEVVFETGFITSGILFLIIASSLYTRMLALSGIPMHLTNFLQAMDLSLITFLILHILIIILLGMVLDSVSALLILLPIALPYAIAMGVDQIWFGIITVIAIELGLLTPPFGLSVFVVKASLPKNLNVSLGDIFTGSAPFVIAMLFVIAILICFPWVATILI